MRFSKVIHPELVLGRRGDEEKIKSLKAFIDSVEVTDPVQKDGGINYVLTGPIGLYLKDDKNLSDHICMLAKFRQEKPPVYVVGHDFGEVLAGVSKDLPLDRLPDSFFGYIHFPEKVVKDESDYVIGAYVYIGLGNETPLGNPRDRAQKIIWVSYIQKNPYDENEFSVCRLVAAVGDHKTIREMVFSTNFGDSVGPNEDFREARMPVFQFIINSVLYIHCQEPSIERLNPIGHLSHSKKKQLARQGSVNLCQVPLIAVNWGFKRERRFGVKETWVDDFYRWQRCGPNLSQIKLTLVRAHPRKYGGKHNDDEGDTDGREDIQGSSGEA